MARRLITIHEFILHQNLDGSVDTIQHLMSNLFTFQSQD